MSGHRRRVLALALGSVLLLHPVAGCRSRPRSCAACGRAECAKLSFTIRFQDGKTLETCCPRCGLHVIESATSEVSSLSVRAFDTAEPLRAEDAFYVEGSDISPCAEMHRADQPRDSRGCCLKPVYDRCLPSLLAFPARQTAEAFARREGGTVRTFAELRPGAAG